MATGAAKAAIAKIFTGRTIQSARGGFAAARMPEYGVDVCLQRKRANRQEPAAWYAGILAIGMFESMDFSDLDDSMEAFGVTPWCAIDSALAASTRSGYVMQGRQAAVSSIRAELSASRW